MIAPNAVAATLNFVPRKPTTDSVVISGLRQPSQDPTQWIGWQQFLSHMRCQNPTAQRSARGGSIWLPRQRLQLA